MAETYSVTFDKALTPGVVDESQFDQFDGVGSWAADDAIAAGSVLSGDMATTGLSISPPRVEFTDLFSDFKDIDGLQIASFSQPATVI